MAIVAVTLAMSPHDYVAAGHCWLNVHTDTIWAFVGPVLFVLTVSREAWGEAGRVTLGKGEALSPADARSPGQHLHPGPRGHGHCGQCPPPCPHAKPTALPAGAGQDPDMVRPGSGGSGWEAHQMGAYGSPWQQDVDLRPCAFTDAKLSLSISVHMRPCSCVHAHSCVWTWVSMCPRVSPAGW